MAKFKDSQGTEWEVRFVLPMVPKLRDAGYDLGKIDSQGGALDSLGDPEKVGQILWVACEAQAEKRGVSPEQFAERFDGPTIHAAVEAVFAATADFTQRPAVAKAIRDKLPGAMWKADQAIVHRLGVVFEQMSPNGSNNSATNSPASPESIPAG